MELFVRSGLSYKYFHTVFLCCFSINICRVIVSGINTGSYYAIGTLLNAVVIEYFPVSVLTFFCVTSGNTTNKFIDAAMACQ